jgi:hypothetical protein
MAGHNNTTPVDACNWIFLVGSNQNANASHQCQPELFQRPETPSPSPLSPPNVDGPTGDLLDVSPPTPPPHILTQCP